MGWRCDSAFCPGTHQGPEVRCGNGIWFCGQLRPACEGHQDANDKCGAGDRWHCGALWCVTHKAAGDFCPGKAWECGAQFCPKKHTPKGTILGTAKPETGCDAQGCGGGKGRIVPHYYHLGLQYISKIVKGLRSSPAQKINIKLMGVHIRGQDYETIAQQIELGRVSIRQDSSIPPGFTMRYNPPTKALLFRLAPIDFFNSLESPRTVQALIHEATHAALHYRKESLLFENNEAVAYVAATLWGFTAGLTPTGSATQLQKGLKLFLSKNKPPFNPVISEKLLSVYSYLVAHGFHTGKPPGTPEINGLHQAICGMSGYQAHCGAKLNLGSIKF
jgi:hypothetical protein